MMFMLSGGLLIGMSLSTPHWAADPVLFVIGATFIVMGARK